MEAAHCYYGTYILVLVESHSKDQARRHPSYMVCPRFIPPPSPSSPFPSLASREEEGSLAPITVLPFFSSIPPSPPPPPPPLPLPFGSSLSLSLPFLLNPHTKRPSECMKRREEEEEDDEEEEASTPHVLALHPTVWLGVGEKEGRGGGGKGESVLVCMCFAAASYLLQSNSDNRDRSGGGQTSTIVRVSRLAWWLYAAMY